MKLRLWRETEDDVLVYALRAKDLVTEACRGLPVRVLSEAPRERDYIAVLTRDEAAPTGMQKHIPVIDSDVPDLERRLWEAILYLRAHKAISG